jgi:ATP-dependent Lhr-like helicase
VEQLRDARHAGNREEELTISAADPLNLTGIVTPGERVPALLRNRILYRNGIPAGAWHRDEFVPLNPAPELARAAPPGLPRRTIPTLVAATADGGVAERNPD